MQASTYLRQLVAANQTKTAIEVLMALTGQIEPDLHSQVILHSGNYKRTMADIEQGKLSREEQRLFFNRIQAAILGLADAIPAEVEVRPSAQDRRKTELLGFFRRFFVPVMAGGWSLLLLLALLLGYLPHAGVDFRMSLRTNRVEMLLPEVGEVPIGRAVPMLQMQHFSLLEIPANYLEILDLGDESWHRFPVEAGLVNLQPVPDKQSGFLVMDVQLEDITFPDSAMVVFTLPEDSIAESPTIQIDSDPGGLNGWFSFEDTLEFECTNCSFLQAASGDSAFIEKAGNAGNLLIARVVVPSGEAYEVRFSGQDQPSKLILEAEGSTARSAFQLRESNIALGDINFVRPLAGGGQVSSVIDGYWEFVNRKGSAYQVERLKAPAYVDPDQPTEMYITAFSLRSRAIELVLNGQVAKFRTGIGDSSSLPARNPSRLTWMVHNQPLIPMGILLIGAVLTILAISWRRRY